MCVCLRARRLQARAIAEPLPVCVHISCTAANVPLAYLSPTERTLLRILNAPFLVVVPILFAILVTVVWTIATITASDSVLRSKPLGT